MNPGAGEKEKNYYFYNAKHFKVSCLPSSAIQACTNYFFIITNFKLLIFKDLFNVYLLLDFMKA